MIRLVMLVLGRIETCKQSIGSQ